MASDLEQRGTSKNLLAKDPVNLLKKVAEDSGTKKLMYDTE